MSIDRWPASDPPPGFTDRVMAARAPRGYRWPFVAAAALAVAAAFGTVWFLPTSGSATPGARTSLKLGRRGVAVAEAGAALRWSIGPTGAAELTQDAGDVFYRVERGGPFTVRARGAQVTVTGTCFRVEVLEMGTAAKMMASAAAGALASATVLVTVYEGSVRVVGSAGSRDVAAGERARIDPGAAQRPRSTR